MKRNQKRPVWMERPNPIMQAVKFVAFLISIVLVLLPFWAVVATSLADQETINASAGMVLWPSGISLASYQAVLGGGVVVRALLISVGVTIVGTLISLTLSSGLAYWLSRPNAPGGRIMLLLLLGAVLFSPGLIPSYLMVVNLGLINSWWALILPGAVSAFNVVVMRAFFMALPQELFEAAAIDGASSLRVLVQIVLPLTKAVLAVMGLFYAVAYWNAFFNALLYLPKAEKWPMALVLRTYVVNQSAIGSDELAAAEFIPPQLSVQMAILVIAIVPILIVYPFLQRHFAKGVLIGAVKG